MKRQWFVLILIFWLCSSSATISSTKTVVVSADVPLEAQSSTTIQRVYGTDLSDAIYSSVSMLNFRQFVREISENGSRYVLDAAEVNYNTNNRNAREYIEEKLVGLSKGRIEVEEIGSYKNVVGKLKGYLPGDNPAFAITAHYDSPETSSGANCDGSGIAAVLELARVMSQYEWPLDIYFIAFNGLFGFRSMQGSPQVAMEFQNRNLEFLMVYNVDTILVQNRALPSDERVQIGYGTLGQSDYQKGQFYADLARMMSNNIGQNRIVPVPSTSFGLWSSSDHYALFFRGFNAICAFESGRDIDTSYHRTSDTWSNYIFDYNLGYETTAVIGASMAHIMGRTYGEYEKLSYDFTLSFQTTEQFYIPVTTPTTLNFSVRWFGGASSFFLLDPAGGLVTQGIFNHSSAWEPMNIFSPYVTTKGLYTLVVQKNSSSPIGYELRITYETDIDGNGIGDSQEYWLDHSYFLSDQDNDGLSDGLEILYGTNMFSSDSDGDTMPDKFEIDMGLDPNNPADGIADADGDLLTNAEEYARGLNLFSADSDSDGMDDFWEVQNGLNPLVDDSMLDPDGDGRTNLQEYLDGTNPQAAETMAMPVPNPTVPLLIIAAIGVFVYVRRREVPWN
jgi:hypothetical protein